MKNSYKFLENRSILLGKILRHNPIEINLSCDKYGWFSVKDILLYLKVNVDTLREIVNFGKKRRYTFNDNETLLRAYQGHSFHVELFIESSIPNTILYHGTTLDVKEIILKEGISKMGRNFVHLSSDKTIAIDVASRRKKEIYIFEIDIFSMIQDGYLFYMAENGVWLVNDVPVRYLR